MNETDRPRRRRDLEIVNRPGEHLIYDPADGTLHRLNASSMALWENCDGTTTVDEMITAVAEVTATDRELITLEVHDALERFRSLGLIETA